MNRIRFSLLMVALLGALVLGATGCSTKDADNSSVRPWDSPMGWENGVPSGMYQNH